MSAVLESGLSFLGLTQIGAHTAYWKIEAELFVNGVGLGLGGFALRHAFMG